MEKKIRSLSLKQALFNELNFFVQFTLASNQFPRGNIVEWRCIAAHWIDNLHKVYVHKRWLRYLPKVVSQ